MFHIGLMIRTGSTAALQFTSLCRRSTLPCADAKERNRRTPFLGGRPHGGSEHDLCSVEWRLEIQAAIQ